MAGKNCVFLRLEMKSAIEAQHAAIHPDKSLTDAAVLTPGGMPLSETALDTLRHMRYYMNGTEGVVLYSDRAGMTVHPGSLWDMLDEAAGCAGEVIGRMPDFASHNMDDGGGLVLMQGAAFCYRPFGLGASLGAAMEARQECLDACERQTPIAVMYCNRAQQR